MAEQSDTERAVLKGGPDNGRTMLIRYERQAIVTRNRPRTVYTRTEEKSGERVVFRLKV
jgi:hypothetical protein